MLVLVTTSRYVCGFIKIKFLKELKPYGNLSSTFGKYQLYFLYWYAVMALKSSDKKNNPGNKAQSNRERETFFASTYSLFTYSFHLSNSIKNEEKLWSTLSLNLFFVVFFFCFVTLSCFEIYKIYMLYVWFYAFIFFFFFYLLIQWLFFYCYRFAFIREIYKIFLSCRGCGCVLNFK